MNNLTWDCVEKLNSATPIKDFEKKTKKVLPQDFVDCVLENNAGYPSLTTFKTDDGTERVFSDLLSFDSNEPENIFEVYALISQRLSNTNIIPFARDAFGNYICFDYTAEQIKVVFWSHETNKFDFVCATFTELLSKLH
jgi:hypothetical protein